MKKLILDIQKFASGTISGGTYNARYSYFMTWTSTSNGSVANTSNVTLNWVFKKTASDSYNAYNTSGTSKVTLVINGNSSGAVRADFDLRSASVGTEKVIASYTVNNIPHNADGTCTINVSGSHNTGLNWGTKSIGDTAITLDTIPRYATCSQSLSDRTETTLVIGWSSDSTIDLLEYSTNNGSSWTTVSGTPNPYTISGLSANTTYNVKTRVRRQDSQLKTESSANQWTTLAYPYVTGLGANDYTIGTSQTVYISNPKNRSVTVYMKYSGDNTQLYSGTTTSNSISFTPTASTLYSKIPNSKSGDCYYYCVYSGQTSSNYNGKFWVDESGNKPTITSYTPYDNNATTYALTNNRAKIVLNASNMQLTIVANAKNSATFNNNGFINVNGTSLTLTISGSDATGVYNLNKPTSPTFTIVLNDSRGIQNTISYTLPNYVSYFPPTINANAVRNQPTDNKLNLSGNGTFFNGSFGSQTNDIDVAYTVTEKSTSTVLETGYMSLTPSGNDYTLITKQVSDADYTKQYVVSFVATDKLSSSQKDINISKGIPVFNWDNDEFDTNVLLQAKNGIITTTDTAQVNAQTISNGLTIKRAGQDYARNNGIVLEASFYQDWGGQLFIPDNAGDGIWYGGWSNGTKSNWKKLAFEYEPIMPSYNLNDINQSGTYFYNNGGQDYTNSPRSDGVHYLVVTTTNYDWVVQEDYYLIWGASEIHKYIRMYTPAGWTNWQTII